MKLNKLLFAILAISSFYSCKKNADGKPGEIFNTGQQAYLKVYNGTLTSARNYLYIDNQIYTGSLFAYNGTFPASTTYATIAVGDRTILLKDTLSTSLQLPLTINKNFEANKYYSLLTYDTARSIKAILVEDMFSPSPIDTIGKIRFVNLAYSASSMPNVDLFSQRLNRNLFSNVSTAVVTPFLNHLNGTLGGLGGDTLQVRASGTTTNLTSAGLIFSNTQRRIYTVIFRGSYVTTGGTTPRSLTFYTNF